MESLVPFIVIMLGASTPLIFAAIGELVTEKSGVLNLGVEGMMLVGAVAAFAVSISTARPCWGCWPPWAPAFCWHCCSAF